MALCNITGTVYLPNGLLAVNREIVFRRVSRNITPEYLGAVLPDDVVTTTDGSGNIDVDLLTGSYMAFADGQPNDYFGKVNVPDAASATFAEVLAAAPPPAPSPDWYTDIIEDISALQNAPVITEFTIESGNYVLVYSDGSRIIGPPAGDVPPVSYSKLSGDTWPAVPQSEPTNLVSATDSDFTSSGWPAASAGGLTIDTVDGVAHWDGSNVGTSVSTIPISTTGTIGNQYGIVVSVPSHTTGALFTGFQMPATSMDGAGFTSFGNYSRQVTATGAYTHARMYVNAGAVLDVDYLKAYDISELLEKKWRIVFVYSQSNWVGPGDAADRVTADTPEPRAVVIPSSENNVRGSFLDAEGVGVPMLMCDPVSHLSGNVGGGPAGAFARTFCDGLRDDEVLVYVAAGYSGGGRSQPGDVWYHDGVSDGEAWTNMLKQVDAMVERAPVGSTVAGCLFCQGEADLADTTGDQHTQLIRGDFELLRARYGEFPIVVSEIGWADTGRADVANMIASHAKLDSNSNDPLSLPLCRYVPRPADSTFLPDTLHYDQPTQRTRGASAATALLELNYGGADV